MAYLLGIALDFFLLTAIIIGSFSANAFIKPFPIVYAQLIVALLVELVALYLNRNVWLYNIYQPLELWLLGSAGLQLVNEKPWRLAGLSGLAGCSLVWALSIRYMGVNTFVNWSFLTECIVLCIIYLHLLISLTSGKSAIVQQPLFWLFLSTVTYYGGNIPGFGMLNYLIKYYPVTAKNVFDINIALGIIRYAMLSVAFILLKQKKASYTATNT